MKQAPVMKEVMKEMMKEAAVMKEGTQNSREHKKMTKNGPKFEI